MITQEESGLTVSQYNSLASAYQDPAFRIVLSQYSFDFSTITDTGSGYGDQNDTFDADMFDNGTIVRAWIGDDGRLYVETLPSEDNQQQTWTQVSYLAEDASTDMHVSVVCEGTTGRVFWYENYSVKYVESTDSGSTWGSVQNALEESGVVFIAASKTTRVHYAKTTGYGNVRLYVAEYDSGWSKTKSEVYWPFLPTSFDAISGVTGDVCAAQDNDIIVMSTDMPPLIKIGMQGTEVVRSLERVQGIVCFRYQNGRWSDHYEIDVVDRAPEFPSRHSCRLSKSGGYIFLCYRRIDGSDRYSHSSVAITRTATGVRWEAPYILGDVISTPCTLIKQGKYTDLISADEYRLRSISTGYVGDSRNALDVTEYVTGFSRKMGDIQQFEITIADAENAVTSSWPFPQNAVLQLEIHIGYYVSGEQLLVKVFSGDVVAVTESEEFVGEHLVIVAADTLSRLNLVRPDSVKELESQRIGLDIFDSTDGTKYSGLRHTAPYSGSWIAEDNILTLATNESPGLAFSTFLPEAWNGGHKVGIKCSNTDVEDYGGPVFRGYDKNNYWAVVYYADDDTIKLMEMLDGNDEVIWQSDNVGWDRDAFNYIYVRFRYSYVWVYVSTDGTAWTLLFEQELPGAASVTDWEYGLVPIMVGRVGYLGYGYCEPETIGYDWPEIVFPEPDLPETLGEDGEIAAFGHGGFYYTTNIQGSSTTWSAWNSGLSDTYLIKDGCNHPENTLWGAVIDYSGELYVTKHWAGGQPWSLALSELDAAVFVADRHGGTITGIDISEVKAFGDYLLAVVRFLYNGGREIVVLRSDDWGTTWQCGDMIKFGGGRSRWFYYTRDDTGSGVDVTFLKNGTGELAYASDRLVFCCAWATKSVVAISDDMGDTWLCVPSSNATLHCEYRSPGPACATTAIRTVSIIGHTKGETVFLAPWCEEPPGGGGDKKHSGSMQASCDLLSDVCNDEEERSESVGSFIIPSTWPHGTYRIITKSSLYVEKPPDCHCATLVPLRHRVTIRLNGAIIMNGIVYDGGTNTTTRPMGPGDELTMRVTPPGGTCNGGAFTSAKIYLEDADHGPSATQVVVGYIGGGCPGAPTGGFERAHFYAHVGSSEFCLIQNAAMYRGMLGAARQTDPLYLEIPEGGTETSVTEIRGGASLLAGTVPVPCRTIRGSSTTRGLFYLGRSWFDDERRDTKTPLVYRCLDSCATIEDITGDLALTSVTGFMIRRREINE